MRKPAIFPAPNIERIAEVLQVVPWRGEGRERHNVVTYVLEDRAPARWGLDGVLGISEPSIWVDSIWGHLKFT